MKDFKDLPDVVKVLVIIAAMLLGIWGAKLTQSPKPAPMKEDLMVHDYVIEHAVIFCKKHDGLHYIVPMKTQSYNGSWSTFCDDIYRIRCQDDTLIEFNTGASGACFDGVGHMQWEETLQQKPTEYYHL